MHNWWNVSWPWSSAISVFKGLLTPIVAVIATYIAWQQYRANRYKLKLDLYQQRFRVFEALRDILAMMYTTGVDEKQLFELLSKTREAQFLFGPEINDYVETVWFHASTLSSAHKALAEMLRTNAPSETRSPMAEGERKETTWAYDETRRIAAKFSKYLDLSKL
jgi:hypothetical protein